MLNSNHSTNMRPLCRISVQAVNDGDMTRQ